MPATTADYGVLIPTPSEPKLDPNPVLQSQLDNLDKQTQPTITKDSPATGDSGCACWPTLGGDDSGNGDATALNDWLDSNGFINPDERRALLQKYVGAGRYFIAVKRIFEPATGPIRNQRTIQTLAVPPAHASLGIVGLVALAWGVRRQRRA